MCPTISVQGSARIRKRPSFLVLLGKLHASAPTLELALQNLHQKREAVSRWLKELGAEELEFGEPRFPDQVEPDPMRIAHKLAQQRMGRRAQPTQEDAGKRSVLVSYSTKWPIADRSSDEVLVFVDRIQFEAGDLRGANEEPEEQVPAWETDPMEEIQSLMSDMAPPPERDEIYFLFLSSMTEAEHEEALAEAFRDGHSMAAMTARSFGQELGELHTAHWSPSEPEALYSYHQMQRQAYFPQLAETPFRTGPQQAVHESLRIAEFGVTVHLTFGLK